MTLGWSEVGVTRRLAAPQCRPGRISRRMHQWTQLVWAVAWVMAPAVIRADSATITFHDAPLHLFPDVSVTVTVQVAVQPPVQGRLTWDFHAAGALIQRGELPVVPALSGKTAAAIPLVIPPARANAAMEARLRAAFWSESSQTVVEAARSFWIMGPKPWEGRQEWLTQLGILLFDPDGTTASLFEESGIPFTAIRNPEALVETGHGVLVIAEGVDFRDYRGLPATMMAVAASGTPVIGLAPAGGAFDLAGLTGLLPTPKTFQLSDPNFVRVLDKRLGDTTGCRDDALILAYFSLAGEPLRLVVSEQPVSTRWTWMEIAFPVPNSRLIVTGHAIAKDWKRTPASRYLWFRLLERVSGLEQIPGGRATP